MGRDGEILYLRSGVHEKDVGLSKHIELCPPQKKELVAWSRLTLCDPMDGSLPGFSAYGILQAIILEWVAIPFSSRSSQPRHGTISLGDPQILTSPLCVLVTCSVYLMASNGGM